MLGGLNVYGVGLLQVRFRVGASEAPGTVHTNGDLLGLGGSLQIQKEDLAPLSWLCSHCSLAPKYECLWVN